MEKYSDLITNGLDLLSFLLVTPEIVKVIAPAASSLITQIIQGLLASVAGVSAMVVVHRWSLLQWTTIAALLVGVVLASAAWQSKKGSELIGKLARSASKHIAALGIALFFVSRLIAFYGKTGLL